MALLTCVCKMQWAFIYIMWEDEGNSRSESTENHFSDMKHLFKSPHMLQSVHALRKTMTSYWASIFYQLSSKIKQGHQFSINLQVRSDRITLFCQEGNFQQWINVPCKWTRWADIMLTFGAQKTLIRSSSISGIHQRWMFFVPLWGRGIMSLSSLRP